MRITLPILTLSLALVSAATFGQCPITIDSLSSTTESCFGSCDGGATVFASGPGNLSYQWYDANLMPVTGATSATLNDVCAGNYSVEVTTDQGGGGSVTVHEETFDGVQTWTLTNATGNNDPGANAWVISDAEGGVTPPNCGIPDNGDATLHMTTTLLPGLGAAYNSGGACPTILCVETNLRAESGPISTIGYNGLTLSFDYISVGDALLDNASVWYNDGSGWTQLTASIKSLICPTGQGEWTAYSETLPASCDNITNLQIGINWTNNDDGLGSDPSVAINNVRITTAGSSGPCTVTSNPVTISEPNALFTLNQESTPASCEGADNGTVTLTAGGGTAPFSFSIDGGNTFANNSGFFDGLEPGTYNLGIQDANGCTHVGDSIGVSVAVLPTPSITGELEFCTGDSVSLFASNGFEEYVWSTMVDSGQVLNVLAGGTYSVSGIDSVGCQSQSDPITVIEHENPEPSIFGDTVICDSENTILDAGFGYEEYLWSPGGETTQTIEVPTGSYSVSVVDFYGCTGESPMVTVNELQFTAVDLQSLGDSIFADPSIGTGFQWHLDGVPIPGGTESSFIAELSGVYTLYYIDEFGCAHFTNGLDHTYVSVEESAFDFTVYPNPAKDVVSISIVGNQNINSSHIQLIDATGRVLSTYDFSFAGSTKTLSVNHLETGLYILRLMHEQQIMDRPIIVSK